jgi:hypothetical protein
MMRTNYILPVGSLQNTMKGAARMSFNEQDIPGKNNKQDNRKKQKPNKNPDKHPSYPDSYELS